MLRAAPFFTRFGHVIFNRGLFLRAGYYFRVCFGLGIYAKTRFTTAAQPVSKTEERNELDFNEKMTEAICPIVKLANSYAVTQ